MASYLTRVGDREILIEAPAASAFAKSEVEIEADPRDAIVNCIRTVQLLANEFGRELSRSLAGTGAAMEINFAVRADTSGMVMVSESASSGQFQCTLRIQGRPPAPRPAPPQRPPRPPQ